MPIWKLEPVNPAEHHWRASAYVGPVFIRAQDELAARTLAGNAFGIAAEMASGAEVPLLPWVHTHLVIVTEVNHSAFEGDGPEMLLGPQDALDRAHPELR